MHHRISKLGRKAYVPVAVAAYAFARRARVAGRSVLTTASAPTAKNFNVHFGELHGDTLPTCHCRTAMFLINSGRVG